MEALLGWPFLYASLLLGGLRRARRVLLAIDDALIRRATLKPAFTPLTFAGILACLFQLLVFAYIYVFVDAEAATTLFSSKQTLNRRQVASNIRLFPWLDSIMTVVLGMDAAKRAYAQHKEGDPMRAVKQLQWLPGTAFIKDDAMMEQVNRLKASKRDFRHDKQTAFDESQHMSLLTSIWGKLLPEQPLPAIPAKDWQRLGFQSESPQSDLRAMGIASLKLLDRFCDLPDARTCYSHSTSLYWYPFACVAVNITAFIDDLMAEDLLDDYLISNAAYIDELFAATWSQLDSAWMAALPKDIMEFPKIWASVRKQTRLDLENHDRPSPHDE